ncbi:MAG TPA: hypothetical protein VFP40_07840 [Terriglobales bacterium]|nr:hypothetical protein [Terriglobales bacterium]
MSQAIVPICEHIRDNNSRCGSPAMDGFHFCYYHARHHLPPPPRGKRKIRLSALESVESLQITLTQVAQAILDDEIPPAKAYALVQILQLGYRAIDNHRSLAANPIALPSSMAHLVEHPQPEQPPQQPTTAPENHSDAAAAQPVTMVPKKRPGTTEQEFEPWRQILLAGTSHPKYLQALEKYDEYTDALEKLPEADSA